MISFSTRQVGDFMSYISIINNRRMFNGATDDLAAKPYIPQKKHFYEFVANALHGNIGIVNFGL